MKTKLFFLLALCTALSIQCTKDSGETEEIVVGPKSKPEIPTSAGSPDDWYGADVYVDSVLYEFGYSKVFNARLVVDSLSARVNPEFQYVVSRLDGSSPDDSSSKISGLFLKDDGTVYVAIPPTQRSSLLYHSNPGFSFDWGGAISISWDLEYSFVSQEGLPDEIAISGRGLGSYVDGNPYIAGGGAKIVFEFRGRQIEGTNDFEGNFTLDETSPEEKYNLQAAGKATLELIRFTRPD